MSTRHESYEDEGTYRGHRYYYCYDRLCWVADWIEAETRSDLFESIDELIDDAGDAEHERRRYED